MGWGWDVEGKLKREGIYVYLWLINFVVGKKPTQVVRQLSSNSKKKKKLFEMWARLVWTNLACGGWVGFTGSRTVIFLHLVSAPS